MKSIDLANKNAIVTGAGAGLGKQIALALADAGANVWIADLLPETAKQTCSEIEALGRRSGSSKVDVSDQRQMDEMVDTATKELGGLDIMVNVAGIFCFDNIDSITQEKLERLARINIFGVVYGCKAAIRNMRQTGRGGVIVNMASVASRAGDPRHPFYHMTKASVLNYNKSVARTAAPEGIRVNAVCPGLIRTAMWESILDDEVRIHQAPDREEYWKAYVKRVIPLGIAQQPENIADAVLFFCSDLSSCVTGQALNVCGGIHMN